MKKLILFAGTILLFSFGLKAQSFADTIKSIDRLFSVWNDSTPGATLIVTRMGETIYNKSFGLSDLEHNVKNSFETVYEAGSVSKQFTAAAIFLLVKEGKLSLADDIRKYIPELPFYGKTITISHLIHHTSGLKDWGSIASVGGWPRGTKAYQPAHVLQIVSRQKSLNFTPGEKYSYSNTNYNLMVTIVERVSNKSFAQFTNERIFIPLQMNNTQWRTDFREVIKNRAIGYGKSGKKYYANMPFENVHGNGGLLTTVSDLLKWNAHYETGLVHNLEIGALQQVKGQLNDGSAINYAGGVFIQSRNGFTEINHSGATAGYRAWLAYYPEQKLSVVYLSNDGSVSPEQVGERLAATFLGTPTPSVQNHVFSKPAISDLKKRVGVYLNKSGFDVVNIQMKDSGIMLRNGPVLKPFTVDSFLLGGNFRVVFAGNEVRVRNGNEVNFYQRVELADTSSKVLNQYLGNYFSEEADASITIELRNGNLFFSRRPEMEIALTPTFKDGFYGNNNSMLVKFLRSKEKKITGFEVSVSRAEKLVFNKLK